MTLARSAQAVPAIPEQITSAVNWVVQQTRSACGSRKVTSITELTGMESGKIQIQEIFKFVSQGYGNPGQHGFKKVQGYFSGCDTCPIFTRNCAPSAATWIWKSS